MLRKLELFSYLVEHTVLQSGPGVLSVGCFLFDQYYPISMILIGLFKCSVSSYCRIEVVFRDSSISFQGCILVAYDCSWYLEFLVCLEEPWRLLSTSRGSLRSFTSLSRASNHLTRLLPPHTPTFFFSFCLFYFSHSFPSRFYSFYISLSCKVRLSGVFLISWSRRLWLRASHLTALPASPYVLYDEWNERSWGAGTVGVPYHRRGLRRQLRLLTARRPVVLRSE